MIDQLSLRDVQAEPGVAHVYHAEEVDRFDAFTVRAAEQFPTGYRRVAIVRSTDLDAVYSLTQHRSRSWQENEAKAENGFSIFRLKAFPARSTSVGDVIVTAEGAFVVASIGFNRLPIEVAAQE